MNVSGQSVKRQGHFICITTCLPCDKIITLYCLEKQKRLYYSYRTVCHETGSTFSVLKLVCHGISRRTVMRLANKGQLFLYSNATLVSKYWTVRHKIDILPYLVPLQRGSGCNPGGHQVLFFMVESVSIAESLAII